MKSKSPPGRGRSSLRESGLVCPAGVPSGILVSAVVAELGIGVVHFVAGRTRLALAQRLTALVTEFGVRVDQRVALVTADLGLCAAAQVESTLAEALANGAGHGLDTVLGALGHVVERVLADRRHLLGHVPHHSAHVSELGHNAGFGQYVTVQPNTNYTFSCWLKSEADGYDGWFWWGFFWPDTDEDVIVREYGTETGSPDYGGPITGEYTLLTDEFNTGDFEGERVIGLWNWTWLNSGNIRLLYVDDNMLYCSD